MRLQFTCYIFTPRHLLYIICIVLSLHIYLSFTTIYVTYEPDIDIKTSKEFIDSNKFTSLTICFILPD